MTPRLPIYRGFFPRGICCVVCGQPTRVIDKRDRRDGTVWRRHQCVECGTRVTTYERIELKKAS